MEETYNTDNGPGLNAMLDGKLPIITDCHELIGFAVDEIGGIWSFQPATTEEFHAHKKNLEDQKLKKS